MLLPKDDNETNIMNAQQAKIAKFVAKMPDNEGLKKAQIITLWRTLDINQAQILVDVLDWAAEEIGDLLNIIHGDD